jgi:hypothetical protein
MTVSWRRTKPRRHLFLACLALGLILIVELAYPRLLIPAAQPARKVSLPAGLSWHAPEPPSLEDFPDAVARPLYSPTRSPGAGSQTQTAHEDGDAAPGALSLAGIVTSGKVRLAIFRVPGQPGSLRLREGSDIGGWSIQQILADRVILTRGGQSQEMLLNAPSKTDS